MIGKQQNKFVYGFGNFPKAYIPICGLYYKQITILNDAAIWSNSLEA
jgi:hypothetical protein